MRKFIISILVTISASLVCSSCNGYLDKEPDDMLTLELVFNNSRKVNEWLARIYSDIPDPMFRIINDMGLLDDDYQCALELVQFGWEPIISTQQGSCDANTSYRDYWSDFYKAIRSGYIFLENVKPLPEQGLTETDVEYMKHEVRYIICYYYSFMLQLYGPVPLLTKEVSSQASNEELMMARTPVDKMMEWLDRELLELAEFFPEKLVNEKMDFGRPTKGICLALRAHLWTMVASPLFNGNPDYADMKNPDGEMLFPANFDQGKWQKAVEANKAVIDLAEKGIYSLFKVYTSEGDIDPYMSNVNLFLTTGETNREIIWSRASSEIGNMELFFNPRSNGSYASFGLTQNLVDTYRMRDGKEIQDPASGYTDDTFTEEDIYDNTVWSYSDKDRTVGLVTPKGTYSMWANREPRFYTTIRHHKSFVVGLNGPCGYAMGQPDGRPSHDTPPCGYHGRKGLDPESTPRSGYHGVYRPAIIFRLAEFYLNYAEALVEVDPSNPDILVYLNRIRERGGLPALPTSLLGNIDELRRQVATEFRVEFAMEGKFRYDYIRRWKIAKKLAQTPIYGMNQYGYDNEPIGSENSFYKRTVVMNRTFLDKMYFWPLKQAFIDKNVNLVQNKGW